MKPESASVRASNFFKCDLPHTSQSIRRLFCRTWAHRWCSVEAPENPIVLAREVHNVHSSRILRLCRRVLPYARTLFWSNPSSAVFWKFGGCPPGHNAATSRQLSQSQTMADGGKATGSVLSHVDHWA